MNTLSDFKTEICTEPCADELFDFFKIMHSGNIYFLPKEKEDILSKYRKYEDNSGKLNLFILKYKGKDIIGCSGYVPFIGMLSGQRLDGFMGSDTIIESNLRRQFPGLAMMFARNYENLIRKDKAFALMCPLNKAISDSYKKVQWAEFAYIYKFNSELAAKIKPNLNSLSIEFKKIEHFEKDMELFFERIKQQYHFILNNNIDFLNWKYFSNPYAKYTVLLAVKNKKILGYIVVEKRLDDIYIVDITVDLEYKSVILLLIFKSLSYFNLKTLNPVICYLSHSGYIEIFKRSGFLTNWEVECLFFKISLLFSKIKQNDFYSLDKNLFHFNGFTQYLY